MAEPQLPVDSDLDVESTPTGPRRPLHLRWPYLGIVAVGGTFGTAAREALTLAVPSVNGVPVVILAINVFGALILGGLLELLMRRGPDEGRRRSIRLLVGTGALGGFTTYSSLATETAVLLGDARTGFAIAYALATVLLGALGTFVGIAGASALHRRTGDAT